MSSSANSGGGGAEGLSLQTLLIAAVASAAAAVIVSHLWKDGTVIAAAMTPVIVAIVKELVAKPMESDLVRRPVSKIASGSRAALSTTPLVGSRTPRGERVHGDPLMDDEPPRAEPPTWRTDPHGPDGDGPLTPMRTYGSPRRRQLHLKVAIVTGLVAFVIAAAALTLPELLFGGAVGSGHSTTLFGGGSSKSKSDKKQDKGASTQPDQQKPDQQTTPTTPAPNSGDNAPTTTTPAPTTPEQQPQQTTPQQTSPVPTSPTPPVP